MPAEHELNTSFNLRSDVSSYGTANAMKPLTTASTPPWVYVFGLIAVVLVLLFIIVHLAGGGLGGHIPP